MWWVLILLILVVAAFAVPKFAKVLLAGIGILVVIIIIWYLKDQHEQDLAKKRIVPNEIQFVDLRLAPSYSPESFQLRGRIKNKSLHFTLTDLRLKITMRDCVKPGDCEIVGETTVWYYHDVPPNQSREIDKSVYFSNLGKPKGKYEWDYLMLEIKGR